MSRASFAVPLSLGHRSGRVTERFTVKRLLAFLIERYKQHSEA